MKSFLLLIFILSFVFNEQVNSQTLPSFPEKYVWRYHKPDYNGSVANIKVITKYKEESIEAFVTSRKEVYIFTSEGKLSGIKRLDPETNKLISAFYFDEHERVRRTENKRGIASEYVYDDGKLTSKWIRFNNPSSSYLNIEFFYEEVDSNVRPKLRKKYRNTGELADSTKYYYNSNGDLVRSITHNTPNGYGITIDASITGDEDEFIPNSSDTVRYHHTYNSDGEITSVTTYRFGKPFKRETYSTINDTSITLIERSYLSFDQTFGLEKTIKEIGDYKIEYIPINSGDITWVYKDNLRVKSLLRRNNEIIEEINNEYQKRYDSFGNWTERKRYRNGELNQIVTREIEYY